jgi:hypothetical protein
VRVEPCEPTGLLGQIVYIDLVGAADKDEARRRLLAGVDQARRKPATEPDLPPLSPDPSVRPTRPEPPWAQTLDLVVDKSSSALWHLLRLLAVALGVAVAVDLLLASQFTQAQDSEPGKLAGIAAMVGVGAALVFAAIQRWWARRLTAGPSAAKGGSA